MPRDLSWVSLHPASGNQGLPPCLSHGGGDPSIWNIFLCLPTSVNRVLDCKWGSHDSSWCPYCHVPACNSPAKWKAERQAQEELEIGRIKKITQGKVTTGTTVDSWHMNQTSGPEHHPESIFILYVKIKHYVNLSVWGYLLFTTISEHIHWWIVLVAALVLSEWSLLNTGLWFPISMVFIFLPSVYICVCVYIHTHICAYTHTYIYNFNLLKLLSSFYDTVL